MATKTFKGRIQNKHDTEANWKVATNFKPLAGELIIYDGDNAHSTPRFKVGDGSTLVSDLPFVNGSMEFDADGFSYEDYGGNVGFFSPMNIILSNSEYKASYDTTSIGYKNISTDVEYNLNFPTKSGTFAVTSDIDVTAAGNNTFTGKNLINTDPVNLGGSNRYKTIDFSNYDSIKVGWKQSNTLDSNWYNYTRYADGAIYRSLTGVDEVSYLLPNKGGTLALTSDIDVTAAGNNTFTGTNTFKTEISDNLYRTLINQNGVSVGGGPATSGILIDVTYGLDNIKRLYGGNTYTYTFPNKNGMFATMDDIPNVISLAKLAQDNTFTGNNTFTGDFSRKTQDSSGVIYYKESISDQGFTVGVGATEAATGTQAIYGYGSIKVTAGAAGTGTLSLPVKTGTLALTSDISAVKTKFFPVGYIYITTSSASPAGIFGGTWERIKDKFLLAAGNTYTAGSTGGSADAVVVLHDHIEYGTNTGGAEDYRMAYKSETGTDYGVYYDPDGATAGSKGVFVRTAGAGVDGTGKNMPPYLAVYVWRRVA